jgi:2-(3-amino-3-carboxypropyl)histidine synthase
MKVLYVESKLKDIEFGLNEKEIKKLPKKLFLAYSIQYVDLAKSIKKDLIEKGISVSGFEQVLGCSKINSKVPILLIGSGRFHAINLYLQAPAVYLLEGKKIVKISNEEVDRIRAKKKASLVKFLSADRVGILVTTKPGQENLNQAIKLKKILEKGGKNIGEEGKEVYIFLSNNIDTNQFENFDIQSWVNTACSGLGNDNPNIINIDEIPK